MGTAALLSLAAAQLAVAAPLFGTSAATDCSTAGAAARAIARKSGSSPTIAQRFDASGTYAGQTVTIATRQVALSLPAESFVGEADGDALIYTTSVAGKSEVHLIDLASGCDAVIARPVGTVRSAILNPDGTAIYVHSVTYPNRSDAGVARYALDWSAPQPAVPPAPDDAGFGLTFGTQLGWSSDDAALSVQSCGIEACRTRLLNLASGEITTFDSNGQGPIVGVTPGHLITFAACDGLPCPVVSIDRQTGATSVISNEAWAAALTGNVVNMSTAAGTLTVAQ
jgi:hypothetical protein